MRCRGHNYDDHRLLAPVVRRLWARRGPDTSAETISPNPTFESRCCRLPATSGGETALAKSPGSLQTVTTMINDTCHVIVRELLCGLPLKKVPNADPLTKNYFDLGVCDAGHRVLLLRFCDTETDPQEES